MSAAIHKTKSADYTIQSADLERLLSRHPHSIPVYISKASNANHTVPDIRKNKFLIPYEYTIANVMYLIRKSTAIRPDQAIFLFIKNDMPPQSMMLQQAYDKYKSPDGLLRITYALENTFG